MTTTRTFLTSACAAAALLGATCGSTAADAATASPSPPAGYKKVSELVKLPEFLPGLGTLYVQPATLPAGPFLAYDRDGKLVSTVYMVPMEDMQAQKKFDELKVGPDQKVEAVSMYYNAGHPGVEKPHYHVVLWHVSEDQAKLK
jgi:Spy/CpxP family protein refolding chaperone